MSSKGVNRRWCVASDAAFPFAPMLLVVWDDLPRLVPDAIELGVLRVLLVEWQRGGGGAEPFEVRRVTLARAAGLTERGASIALDRLVGRGVLGRTKDGFRGAARYSLLPLLRRVQFAPREGNQVPRTSEEPRSPLASETGPREGNHVPREGNHVHNDRNHVPLSERGIGVESERERARARARAYAREADGLPLATGDARRACIDLALGRTTNGGLEGGEQPAASPPGEACA